MGAGAWSSGPWAAMAVFVGAGLGALLRWALAVRLNDGAGGGWPWGTLAANLLGGLLVGVALHLLGPANPLGLDPQRAAQLRMLMVTGVLGGLTTFSTFSAEVITLAAEQRWVEALIWAGAHLMGSLALTVLGMTLARHLLAGTAIS